MLGLHETSKGEEDLVTEHGEWEVGSLGVGSLGVGSLGVGGYLSFDFKVFLKAAMLFIKSKACL